MVGMNVCRLCLYDGDEELIFLINNEDLIKKIQECVSVEISENDVLPTTVCRLCIQKVNEWSSFKDVCLRSTKILLESLIKKEKTIEGLDTHKKTVDDSCALLNEKSECFDNKINFNVPENVYMCEICSKDFRNFFEYLDHQIVHDGEAVFKCDRCPEVFTSRQDLVKHDRKHQKQCLQCGKMLLERNMKSHLIKHTDLYMCTQCPSRFNSNASLQQHIITLHTNQKDYICEICGKRFSSRSSMNLHLKSHSDKRLYPCKLCVYAGRTASALYAHMFTHGKDECICEVCSKTFKSNRDLYYHQRRVHQKEKKHQCTHCDKTFFGKYKLRVHLRCHTGDRPYPCKICDKAFMRSDALKEHMAIHGNRIMFNCEKCAKKFASKKGLIRHKCSAVIT